MRVRELGGQLTAVSGGVPNTQRDFGPLARCLEAIESDRCERLWRRPSRERHVATVHARPPNFSPWRAPIVYASESPQAGSIDANYELRRPATVGTPPPPDEITDRRARDPHGYCTLTSFGQNDRWSNSHILRWFSALASELAMKRHEKVVDKLNAPIGALLAYLDLLGPPLLLRNPEDSSEDAAAEEMLRSALSSRISTCSVRLFCSETPKTAPKTKQPKVKPAKELPKSVLGIHDAEPAPSGFVNPTTGERGGPKGPEPTRYGDWERKGRVSDF
uniref:Succinate dehydrogenase assembly factor 4, mitochondrial n=1 Tax=Steinernema glaseri TaxID=37863 RepID=A0A1I8A639_9BILA